jgi:hypothetical protein
MKKKIKQNKRRTCTKETPCDGKGEWAHPQAKIVYNEIYILWYKCPICGAYFGETQPDY